MKKTGKIGSILCLLALLGLTGIYALPKVYVLYQANTGKVDICLKENQILCRKIEDIPVKEAIVFVQLTRTQITVRDDEPTVIPLCRTGNKMRFLRINTAAHLKHAAVGTDLP